MTHALTLEIALGNAAMSTRTEVADALRDVAFRLEQGGTEGGIRDVCGNTVGRYSATFPDPVEGEE